MDVEYIALETTGEFLTQGRVMDIGKEHIVVTNRNRDGYIFIYDRTGKGLRKINRMGRGPEEYTHAHTIILDEDNNEIFVHDNAQRKIVVYDLNGTFKRSFKYNHDDEALRYSVIHNYDRSHLICYDATGDFLEERPFCHVLISKQ
ncbi:MAG: 6-bladed beta-propeller, partial [Bacteroidales bacterium]|nr:6-bladed beta-propeller [Bacteroidales bacterium]